MKVVGQIGSAIGGILVVLAGILVVFGGFWGAMYIPWQPVAVVAAVLFVASLSQSLWLRRKARRASPSQTASSLRH